MKPAHIKEQRQKQIIKIEKRLREIYKLQRALGYRKLEKPIRHGWFKEVVLTSKIERYRNYEHIITVFKKCKIQVWGADKGKAEAKWYKGVEKHEIYGSFKLISRKAYNKLPNHLKHFFRIYTYKNEKGKWRYKYYLHIAKECYRTKYTRAYVTHSRVIDPELEREEALLDSYQEKKGYYNLYQKRWNLWKRCMKKYQYIPQKRSERSRENARLNRLKGSSLKVIIENEEVWQN